jgi:hypothetical protein
VGQLAYLTLTIPWRREPRRHHCALRFVKMSPPQVETNMIDRAEAWFHLFLVLSVGTILYITMFGGHR